MHYSATPNPKAGSTTPRHTAKPAVQQAPPPPPPPLRAYPGGGAGRSWGRPVSPPTLQQSNNKHTTAVQGPPPADVARLDRSLKDVRRFSRMWCTPTQVGARPDQKGTARHHVGTHERPQPRSMQSTRCNIASSHTSTVQGTLRHHSATIRHHSAPFGTTQCGTSQYGTTQYSTTRYGPRVDTGCTQPPLPPSHTRRASGGKEALQSVPGEVHHHRAAV
jgi:hypothetical protein